jgi:hypothetical protein
VAASKCFELRCLGGKPPWRINIALGFGYTVLDCCHEVGRDVFDLLRQAWKLRSRSPRAARVEGSGTTCKSMNARISSSQGGSSQASPNVEPAVPTSDSTRSVQPIEKSFDGVEARNQPASTTEAIKNPGHSVGRLQRQPRKNKRAECPLFATSPARICETTRAVLFPIFDTELYDAGSENPIQRGIRKKKERPGATAKMLPGRTRAST